MERGAGVLFPDYSPRMTHGWLRPQPKEKNLTADGTDERGWERSPALFSLIRDHPRHPRLKLSLV